MMFGLFEMLHHGYFPTGSKILAIHTGGLQGNIGLNKKYKAELPVPSF
jgi:1-aminocyclopropane-1-carboxylate deaminase